MPLSDSQKFTYRQPLEYEMEKPEKPTDQTDEAWDAAWQEVIVMGLTRSPRKTTQEFLSKYHPALRDIIPAIHRYTQPYHFYKHRPIGSSNGDPLISEVYDYLFEWIVSHLSSENQKRVSVKPALPPDLVNKKVSEVYLGEQLIYRGLTPTQNYLLSVLLHSYGAYIGTSRTFIFTWKSQSMWPHFRNNSLPALQLLAHLVSPLTAKNEDQERILDDFYALASTSNDNLESFASEYILFKKSLRENLLLLIAKVQAALAQPIESIIFDQETEVAIIMSMTSDKILELFSKNELLTSERIAAALSVTPPEQWNDLFEAGDPVVIEGMVFHSLPKNYFNVFMIMPAVMWNDFLAVPFIKNRFQDLMKKCDIVISLIENLYVEDRWTLITSPAFREILPDLLKENKLQWTALAHSMPDDRVLDVLLLPELVKFYENMESDFPYAHMDIFSKMRSPRVIEFLLIPGISKFLAVWLVSSFSLHIYYQIPEPYRHELYFIPETCASMMSGVFGFNEIMHVILGLSMDRRLEFLCQKSVESKLMVYLNSGFKLSTFLVAFPQSSWNEILLRDFLFLLSSSTKALALTLARDYFDLKQSGWVKQIENSSAMIANAFANDLSGEFIVSANCFIGFVKIPPFLVELRLKDWSRFFSLPGVVDLFKKNIKTLMGFINQLRVFVPEKRWAFVCFCPGGVSHVWDALATDSSDSDEILSLLDPTRGDAEYVQQVYDHMTAQYKLQKSNDERSYDSSRFLFFHPRSESADKAFYQKLEKRLLPLPSSSTRTCNRF